MSFDFSSFKEKLDEVKEWLARELGTIRTGRATSAILNTIRVDSYGAKQPIDHIAGVTTEDAKTLRITPWDKSHTKEIERAINDAGLGLSIVTDDAGLRVIFPELTSERRGALMKLVNGKLEEAHVSVKKAREDAWGDIQNETRAGTLSEDDKFREKNEMQKLVDEVNKKLDEMAERKEKEISA